VGFSLSPFLISIFKIRGRAELAGGEIVERAQAAGEFGGGQATLAVEAAKEIGGGGFPFRLAKIGRSMLCPYRKKCGAKRKRAKPRSSRRFTRKHFYQNQNDLQALISRNSM
jgi:hypothetical protein